MWDRKTVRWYVTVLVGVLVVLLITCSLTLVFFFKNVKSNTLEFEVAKALLQLGVVSVFGVIFSLLAFEYQRGRQLEDKERDLRRNDLDKERDLRRSDLDKERDLRRKNLEYREDLLKSTIAKTMEAYSSVKKVRRLVRAQAILEKNNDEVVLGNAYDKYMDMINDLQLTFEDLAQDVETSAPAFSDFKSLISLLRSIESYLRELIKEYEVVRRKFKGAEPINELYRLPELKKFISRPEDKQFREEVIEPYHKIQKIIRADLLHPKFITEPSNS